ncbi:MAG: hypothetical protein KAH00_02780 [Cocleimonas sp.]|nr:hypothetical protein [Cocleimonas sp.]
MNKYIKLSFSGILLVGLITGCSQRQNAIENNPYKNTQQCYKKVKMPDQYKTTTKKVLVSKARTKRVFVRKAQYGWSSKKVMVRPVTYSYQYIPAQYKTVKKRIMAKPSYYTWKKGQGKVTRIDHATGEVLCRVKIPAVYKMVSRKVLVRAGHKVKKAHPAIYKQQKSRKLISPAQYKIETIPARYITKKQRVKIKSGNTVSKPIACKNMKTPHKAKISKQPHNKNKHFYTKSRKDTKEHLGKLLFNDKSLSRNKTQSCASCHDSKRAFIDSRVNQTSANNRVPGAVSLGQDGRSLGDINTPSAAYKAFNPNFHFDKASKGFKGGLFLDGRVEDLVEQAGQPFINPVEMQNTKENVVAEVKKKYAYTLRSLYGDHIFYDNNKAYLAITDAIAAFERTDVFSPFDSKFDRHLRGTATLTRAEQRGLSLFKNKKKGNCAACHPVPVRYDSKTKSLLTNFTYHNLGTPKNRRVRSMNNKGLKFVDKGVLANPKVNNPKFKGAFRTSGLRNVAVTAPYMHNGVFKDLSTVVYFYNTRDVKGAKNPETGKAWRQAEVDKTKNIDKMGNLKLSNQDVADIVSFLKTLTDKRYEHLIR